MPAFDISPASPHELMPALRWVFGTHTDPHHSHEAFVTGSHDPAGLLAARDAGGRVCGAMLVQPMPGALGVVWPPHAVDDPTEDSLALVAFTWLRAKGVKVCQAFATADEMPAMALLKRHGFRHVTQLVFLRAELGASAPLALADRLRITPERLPYSEEFRATLLATHVGTRDCPELSGGRTDADVLAGFTDPTTPAESFLATRDGAAVGLVMLAPGAEPTTLELSYVGVVPAQRGAGLGGELVTFAAAQAVLLGASTLTISVDARNEPAMRLYRRHGFVETGRREVFLASSEGRVR